MVRRNVVLVLALVALAASACGGGEDPGGAGSAQDCVDLTSSGDPFEVTIADFEYDPACFTASASQSISITNQDDAIHSFTLEGTQIDLDVPGGETVDGAPVSGVVEPGTYTLVCRFHPEMKGEVTIVA